jgi:SNF2 family DNA or RNA helicase
MNRWQNQEEAFQFAMSRNNCMLDMGMGTGKTRVAIDVVMARSDVHKILIVCPKAVIGVWRENLQKFYPDQERILWECWDMRKGTILQKTTSMNEWLKSRQCTQAKLFIIVNYDAVWRVPMGDFIYKKAGFDMVILDESHRAKAAGSKTSKYLGMVGKTIRYKMCLSGTPMANSPLDVYGQYRFLDPSIYGTNHNLFEQTYAIKGGPDLRFIVGYKNLQQLQAKFQSIAYSCKMSEIADRIKLPAALPPIQRKVELSPADMKTIKTLSRELISECSQGHIVASNVLVSLLRIQQICSGFCLVQQDVFDRGEVKELNTVKEDELQDILEDIDIHESIVVFCQFRHDLESVRKVSERLGRLHYELSGSENTLEDWKAKEGAVIAVQIQAGSEGVDMTKANYAIYYSVPHSLAMYEQSKARLYRPGQTRPVSFIHIIAEKTADESIYNALIRKKDIIDAIKDGTFDFGYIQG